ncbi:MAG TPA: site-specific integrase [Alphaproteobacteria bacterium]|nr:site-specific integrase [Alphaproteobacteria bacterium]
MIEKRRHLRSHLKPFFGSQRLDAISTFTVDRYKRRRVTAGATNGTVNLELGTLSHLLRRAVEWRWLKALPCKIEHLDRPLGRIIALTDEQADQLLRAAAADSDPYCWLFVAFGLNTAMRHREILKARFEHLDLERNRLFVPKAKAGMREQPITPELASILRKELEMANDPKGWIFPSPRPGATLTGHRDRMSKPFRRAVIAAALDPRLITPHVMRHTAITALVKAGVDLPTIQRISGHKTLAMVLRYTHVHGEHIDQAIRAIGRAIPEPSGNRPPGAATPGLHTPVGNVTPLKPAAAKIVSYGNSLDWRPRQDSNLRPTV